MKRRLFIVWDPRAEVWVVCEVGRKKVERFRSIADAGWYVQSEERREAAS